MSKKKVKLALAGVAQWIERGLRTKGSLVQFPVGSHAWIAGQVPSGGHVRGNHTLMFLSLSFSLPSPLSKNLKKKSNHLENLEQTSMRRSMAEARALSVSH